MYTAWMVLIQKIGLGFRIELLGVILSLSGYQSAENCSGAMTFIQQPESAIFAIRLCMGLIPALLVIIPTTLKATGYSRAENFMSNLSEFVVKNRKPLLISNGFLIDLRCCNIGLLLYTE